MCRQSAASRYVIFTLVAVLIVALAAPADARARKAKRHYKAPPTSELVIDGTTGKVIHASKATAERFPASLTKMMTLYLLFEQLKQGKLTMESMITASHHAAAQKPTKLGLSPGESISVEVAVKALIVRSANDVAVAVAESLGGTESGFAEMMTRKARQLGMTQTVFRNASGLPNPNQVSSARDLALLGQRIAYDFPQYYHYFATPSFTFQGRLYQTHDNLLYRFEGVDGIKTGYTNASGFNLVSSLVREGKHIIGVVMGGRSAHGRDNKMMELLASVLARSRKDPTLVASANVPWRSAVSQNRTVSEFEQTRRLNLRMNGFDEGELPDTEDEDLAERMTAQSDVPAVSPAATSPIVRSANTISPNNAPIQLAQQNQGGVVASLPLSSAPLPPVAERAAAKRVLAFTPPLPAAKPAVRPRLAMVEPTPKPGRSEPAAQFMVVASLVPIANPKSADEHSASAPQGDAASRVPAQTGQPPAIATGVKAWMVQIGAFNDKTAAKTQLTLYAERSMDILGRAKRSVVPFDSVDGRKLYRARFGPFVENEAREVCRRMTARGQTCFAAYGAN
ncbi:MAG: serine hydrolase [Alphaproteobacteria bacterium]